MSSTSLRAEDVTVVRASGVSVSPAHDPGPNDDGDLWDTWDDSDGTDEDNWDSH